MLLNIVNFGQLQRTPCAYFASYTVLEEVNWALVTSLDNLYMMPVYIIFMKQIK